MFLTGLFEVSIYTPIPSGVHPHKKTRKKEAFGLLALILTGKPTHPVTEALLPWHSNLFIQDSKINQRAAAL